MLKFLTASTGEIDDADAAVSDILSQIGENDLLTHSVGIVGCHPDFITTGTLAALVERLPFDLVGCTVLGSATAGEYGMERFSVTVLTSDDIRFSVALSPELSKEDSAGPLQRLWQEARDKLPGDPGLIIAFFPIGAEIGGAYMLKQLDAVCGGPPIFGTLSNGIPPNYQESHIFLNGDVHASKAALLLLHGPVHPRFHIASISPRNILTQKAVVTKSDGYFISEVNQMPFMDYLATIGVSAETLTALSTLPFMVDYGDGAPPVALAMYSLSPEGALCGGEIPVGAHIAFTVINYESIMETTGSALQQALNDAKKNGANGILAIPCLTRSLMLSPHAEDEMQKTVALAKDGPPYMMIYSGGEICPVYDKTHAVVNRFHNYTYTLVIL